MLIGVGKNHHANRFVIRRTSHSSLGFSDRNFWLGGGANALGWGVHNACAQCESLPAIPPILSCNSFHHTQRLEQHDYTNMYAGGRKLWHHLLTQRKVYAVYDDLCLLRWIWQKADSNRSQQNGLLDINVSNVWDQSKPPLLACRTLLTVRGNTFQ